MARRRRSWPGVRRPWMPRSRAHPERFGNRRPQVLGVAADGLDQSPGTAGDEGSRVKDRALVGLAGRYLVRLVVSWSEDRATLRSDLSAEPGVPTGRRRGARITPATSTLCREPRSEKPEPVVPHRLRALAELGETVAIGTSDRYTKKVDHFVSKPLTHSETHNTRQRPRVPSIGKVRHHAPKLVLSKSDKPVMRAKLGYLRTYRPCERSAWTCIIALSPSSACRVQFVAMVIDIAGQSHIELVQKIISNLLV